MKNKNKLQCRLKSYIILSAVWNKNISRIKISGIIWRRPWKKKLENLKLKRMRFFNGIRVSIAYLSKLLKLNNSIIKEIRIDRLKYKIIRIMWIIWRTNKSLSKTAGKEHFSCWAWSPMILWTLKMLFWGMCSWLIKF